MRRGGGGGGEKLSKKREKLQGQARNNETKRHLYLQIYLTDIEKQ